MAPPPPKQAETARQGDNTGNGNNLWFTTYSEVQWTVPLNLLRAELYLRLPPNFLGGKLCDGVLYFLYERVIRMWTFSISIWNFVVTDRHGGDNILPANAVLLSDQTAVVRSSSLTLSLTSSLPLYLSHMTASCLSSWLPVSLQFYDCRLSLILPETSFPTQTIP